MWGFQDMLYFSQQPCTLQCRTKQQPVWLELSKANAVNTTVANQVELDVAHLQICRTAYLIETWEDLIPDKEWWDVLPSVLFAHRMCRVWYQLAGAWVIIACHLCSQTLYELTNQLLINTVNHMACDLCVTNFVCRRACLVLKPSAVHVPQKAPSKAMFRTDTKNVLPCHAATTARAWPPGDAAEVNSLSSTAYHGDDNLKLALTTLLGAGCMAQTWQTGAVLQCFWHQASCSDSSWSGGHKYVKTNTVCMTL